MGTRRVVVVSIVFLVLSIVGLIIASYYHGEYSRTPSAFAVVVDAGSSHTDVSASQQSAD
jgi:hypothetical protein